ncbi:MAG: hypothetical protein QXX07_04110 [Candidatus Aenigmatarchaeota archaeon]
MLSFMVIPLFILTFIVVVELVVSVYYSFNLLKNFKKNLNFALLMLFTHSQSPKAFKVILYSVLIFLCLDLIQFLFITEPWISWIATVIYLFGFIYFLKTLERITRES